MSRPTSSAARDAFDKGLQAHLRRDSQRAIEELQRTSELAPDFTDAYIWLGGAYEGGHLERAVAAYSEAIRLAPQWAIPYHYRSSCYKKCGEGARADADLKTALSLPMKDGFTLPDFMVVTLASVAYLDQARAIGVDVESVLRRIASMPEGLVRHYPDGTVQVEGEGASTAYVAAIENPIRDHELQRAHREDPLRMRVRIGRAGYTSLDPFPTRQHNIALWGDVVWQWEGEHLVVMTGVVPEQGQPEVNGPIDKLPVTVAFKRRLSKKSRQQLAELIGQYLASMRAEGVFGEGPVRPVSREIEFYPRVARFFIDASRSGQNSINWLILSLIGFSSVNLPTDIYFTEQPSHQPGFVKSFEQLFNLSPDKCVRSTIPGVPTAAAVPGLPDYPEYMDMLVAAFPRAELDRGSQSEEAGRIPADAFPLDPFQSEYFRILQTPRLKLESLVVTIHFEELPRPGERDSFADSIRHWLNIGLLGGYGGSGFDAYGELEYDEENEAAAFRCDLGSTEWELAFRILINVLETWSAHGISIAAVVFG